MLVHAAVVMRGADGTEKEEREKSGGNRNKTKRKERRNKGALQGSCGYGVLDKTEWPYWSVAGISVKSPFYIAGPLHACGGALSTCFNGVHQNGKKLASDDLTSLTLRAGSVSRCNV